MLGDILKELLEDLGSESRLAEAAIVAAWQDISGPQVAQVTESVVLDGKRLVVRMRSAAWRQELHLQRTAWRERLNAKLGRKAIDEIVFR